MIRFEEAREMIEHLRYEPVVETADLQDALYRVLAGDVRADMDMPPFDKSAMDGFACRREDLDHPLKVVETIAAGQDSGVVIRHGECARIMTGARVPEGADCVIMFEDTNTAGDGQTIFTAKKTSSNICYHGEDVRSGDLLVKKGTLLEPRHMASLAGMGYTHPKVFRRPQTGIFVTGDELVEAGVRPSGTKIRNSNGPQLEAQCRSMYIPVKNYGIIGDSKKELRAALDRSVKENNVTLISGGVSMGDFDFMPEIIKEAGFDIHFHGIKAKPGKRTLFAGRDNHFVFGLPGNPVSAMVQFEMLVKPLLLLMQGAECLPAMEEFRINSDYPVKNTERTSFIPVVIHANGTVDPVEYHGSAHIFAYNNANGFMEIPLGVGMIREGETVHVRRL